LGWKCKGDEIRLSNLDRNNDCWLLYLLNLKNILKIMIMLYISILLLHGLFWNGCPYLEWKMCIWQTIFCHSVSISLLSFCFGWKVQGWKWYGQVKERRQNLSGLHYVSQKSITYLMYNDIVSAFVSIFADFVCFSFYFWGKSARVTTIWSSKMEWTSSTLAKITV